MHLGIAFPLLVFGRGCRGNQGGVDNRAFTQEQAAFGQPGVDRLKQGFGQLLVFQQATELEQSGGIRGAFLAQIDADEAANRLAVVDGV